MKNKMNKQLKYINELIEFLKNEKIVYIQPHNFPDHDAICSAFALQEFLKLHSISTKIVYDKFIQRKSLRRMIKDLSIEVFHHSELDIKSTEKIILVDGCKGNSNITDLPGDEIAVIDHHHVSSPDDVKFPLILNKYGACATIIGEFFKICSLTINEKTASALMIGISMDTALFSRRFSPNDLEIYRLCYEIADVNYVCSVLRNNTRKSDLKYFSHLIDNFYFYGPAAFCHFENGCDKNLLGVLADFTLSLDEIDFVVLSAENEDCVNFSLRSEVKKWDTSLIIQDVLKDIGYGGGHQDMSGGIINNPNDFNELSIRDKIINHLNITKKSKSSVE